MRYLVHKVNENENIEGIAKRYCMDVDEFLRLNNLIAVQDGFVVDVFSGMLVIVYDSIYEKYIVQPFDTLESIALNLNLNIDSVKSLNPTKWENLFIGQTILLPKQKES